MWAQLEEEEEEEEEEGGEAAGGRTEKMSDKKKGWLPIKLAEQSQTHYQELSAFQVWCCLQSIT